MPIFNVRVQRIQRFFYSVEANTIAESKTKAEDQAKTGDKDPYYVLFQSQAVLVDPDAI